MTGIVQALFVGAGSVYDTAWPNMTSNTAPAGYVMSASSQYSSSFAAWYAHDGGVFDPAYWSATGGPPAWLQIQFPTVRKATDYTLTSYATSGNGATDWTLQGSNDGVAWTILDTRTSSYADGTFTISSPTPYLYYQFNITGKVGGNCNLRELNMTFSAS